MASSVPTPLDVVLPSIHRPSPQSVLLGLGSHYFLLLLKSFEIYQCDLMVVPFCLLACVCMPMQTCKLCYLKLHTLFMSIDLVQKKHLEPVAFFSWEKYN
jgi:hypothetical protein